MAQVRIKIVHKNFSEAKRSVIDANDFRNFEALKEKIQKIFPTLCESNFKIFWKDNDGDQITIADDDDLSIAFDEMNSETKVFYVENDSGCPFADSSNLNSLRGMAQQYLEPWRTTLGTENAQKFVEMLRNASDGIFGTGNAPPRLTESEVQTEQSSAKKDETAIQNGLKQLQEMGFHDDHGCLRKMLEYYNGNVGTVLKILSK